MWGFLFAIGLSFLGKLFNKPVKQYGPRLEDRRVTAKTYGEPIRRGWGANRWEGKYIWVEGNQLREKKKSKTSGGVTTVTYHYYATFAVSWGSGPITAIRRIWLNDKLVYNVMPDNKKVAKKIVDSMTHYLGDQTQETDPYMESVEGIGKVPSYRGQAYTLFKNVRLDDFGSQLPSKVEAEVVASGDIVNDLDIFELPENPNTDAIYFKPWGMPEIIYAIGGSTVIVVDIYDQSVQKYFPASESDIGGGDWCFDFFGYAYAWGFGAYGFVTVPLVKYSKDFKYLGWTVDYQGNKAGTDQPSGGYCVSFVDYMGVSLPYIWILGGISGTVIEGVQPFIFGQSLMGGKTLILDGDMWLTYLLNPIPNPATTGYGCEVLQGAVDKNGDCWAVCGVPSMGHTGGFLIHCMIPPVVELLDALFIPYFGNEKFDISPSDLEYPLYITYFQNKTGDDFLIVGGQHSGVGRLIKYSLNSKTVISTLDFSSTLRGGNSAAFKNGPSSGGIFWLVLESGYACEVDCKTLTILRQVTCSSLEFTGTPSQLLIDDEGLALWGRGTNSGWVMYIDRVSADKVTLSSIITDIAEQMSLTSSDIDVSDLSGINIDGISVTGDSTGRSAIETLQSAFFFDAVESDWKLKFPLRTGISDGTIDEDELGAHVFGDSRPVPLLTNREIDMDIPQTIEVKYIDVDQSHESRTQFSTRVPTTMNSRNKETIDIAVVMDKDLAKQISEKMLYLAWKQKEGEYEFAIPWKYLKYDPTDVLTIPYKDNSFLLLLNEIQIGANLLMECKALPDADYCYVSNATGTEQTSVSGQEDESLKNSKGQLDPYFLDIPLVDDRDDDCGFYLAARSSYYWYGAKILESNDGIRNFDRVGNIEDESVIGRCLSVLGSVGSVGSFDLINSLTIQLYDADSILEDATEADVLNGVNLCLVGDEIIRFMNATDNGSGSWTISALMRGLRGTEWAVGGHTTGERFVILNDSKKYDRIKLQSEDIEQTRFYVVMPPDADLGDHQIIPFVCDAVGKKPYAPCHVTGTRDGSNNLTITWIRRTRIGGEWRDNSDVPLGETTKSFKIDIYKSGSVVRTITATTESASYTAAQQTADGITPGSPVNLIAYQISATVDRGYGASATI
ncbi:MAG: phage tail protein [Thermodesulfobacteriota bacterium]|nr:MAG: phage tail protein [Thermodesulfobacteriota bacterium]